MTEKEFKYSSEGAVLMYLSDYQILQQTELEEYSKWQKTFTEDNSCNLYFILKRPRITVNPSSFKVDKEVVFIEACIHVKEEKHFMPVYIRNKFGDTNIHLESEYPYNFFSLQHEEEEPFTFKVSALLDTIQRDYPIHTPILVLYIGQSFGDGKRTAMDRLASHSTLQKIYAEASYRNPDSEIWLMLSCFKQKNVASFNGRITIKESEQNDLNRFLKFSDKDYLQFTEQQRINFTEAALIKCFAPLYNKEYKDTFPSPAHKTYSECYKLDINAIVIEVETSDMKRCLFTEKKPRSFYQHEIFYMPTEEDRWKMFTID